MNVKAFFLILLLLIAACRDSSPTDITELPTKSPTEVPLAFTPETQFVPDATSESENPSIVVEVATQEPTSEPAEAYPVAETATTPAEPVVVEQPPLGILPAAVYFIDGVTKQVTRMERDGLTTTMVTDEATGVEEFAISADMLVYETNNDLVALNLTSGERHVLVTGDKMSDAVLLGEAVFSPINAPTISPDGSQVAFALNGIQTIALQGDAQPTMRLPSDPTPDFSDPNVVIPEGLLRYYFGAQWSPDGSQLAVEFAYFPEGGGIGIFDLTDGSFTDITEIAQANGAVGCCEFKWLAPGQALLASDLLVYGTPGVAQVDTVAKTVTPLITSLGDSDELPTLFRAPTQDGAGRTLAFAGELSSLDAPASYFQIVQINSDSSTSVLQDGLFALEQSVLWTPNGDGVLIGEGRTPFPAGVNGGTFWVQLAGEVVTLPVEGRNFRWAVTEAAPLAQLDIAGLREMASADLLTNMPDGEIAIRRILAKDRLLYIAHTVGSRSYDPPSEHMLGIYEYVNGTWELLGLTPLGDDGLDQASSLGYGPDYMGEGSVMQVFIEPTNLWLFVSGGVGAHSGVAKLFKFDGMQLQSVARNDNGSPFAGWVEDLNGDGLQELIFDDTDPYIFCYACGVRRVEFEVMSWNGSALETVALRQVEGNEANNRAVELAQAGLWIDAAGSAYQLREMEDATVQWNAYLIDLTSRYRVLVAESAYPIMSRMYTGDYFGAVAPFSGLAPETIFDINGELFAGTVADGWTDTMFPEIIETTTRAIAAKPEEAGAYFLRGWAKFFMNDGSALEDIARSAELSPSNPTFTAARDYLTP